MLGGIAFMKNAIITGTIAATILIVGPTSFIAQAQESAAGANTKHFVLPKSEGTNKSAIVEQERAIVARAKSIKLAEFKLDGVTLAEAVRQLSDAAKQSDPSKEVNFVITKPATTAASAKITLALKEVSVKEAAERIAKAAGIRVTAQDFAFVFDAKTNKP